MNSTTDKYPKYVKLRTPNPYEGGVVVCNGIKISDKDVTLIMNPSIMKKLSPIKKYIIEEDENV